MTSLGSAIVSPQGPNSELRDAHRVAVRVSQDILAAASRRCTRSHPPAADGTIIRQAVGLTFDGPMARRTPKVPPGGLLLSHGPDQKILSMARDFYQILKSAAD